ncbi:DNA topoisomerase 2 [Massospora cicadina]|nr:DNA topoisomerase 2 [Massospora cicadina]
MPQPKKQKEKQKAVTKAIPKKAANSKAPSKLRTATVPRTDFVTTNEVERAESDMSSEAPKAPEGGGKKKTFEEIYKKLMLREHILLRPNMYIGSTEMSSQRQWIYDDTTDSLIEKDIQFVPGFLKIFDEILVNAADNKIWDPTMSKIKVTIDPEQNLISVYNNGSGIPVEIHKEEKVYIPELIFGHLFTLLNYVDSENKAVGRRNGYGVGAKLCNIFSTEFIVETASKESGKKYYQKFTNNMSMIGPPKITELGKGEEFTRITFRPDLSKFQMNHLNADIVGLLKWRVYDMCATVKGVGVFLNDSELKLNSFNDYIQMSLKSAHGPDVEDLTKRLIETNYF